MSEHSNIMGGSSAERRILCYGSYHAELPYPNKSTEFTEMGTACHEAMEHILLTDCAPTDVIGMTFNKGNPLVPEGFTIDDGDDGLFHTKIMPAYEAWQDILAKYGELDFTVEAKCDLSELIEGAYGRVDVLGQLINEPATKIVADWKFGSQPVSAYASYQCGFYASAALHTKTDPDVAEIMDGAEKIIFIIIQPDNGEPSFSEWETNVKWLDMYVELAQVAVERAKDEDAPRMAGKHCKWCAAKADCETQKALAMEVLEVDPVNTTAIERAYWLKKADEVGAWVAAIRKAAHEDVERGVAIPGWKQVDKRATRKFTGVDDAELARILGGVIGEDKIYVDPKLKSPTQAENELKAQWSVKVKNKETVNGVVAKRGGWQKIYDDEIAPHVSKVSSGTKLVPVSDPAPAVTTAINQLGDALKAVKSAKPGKHGGH